MDDSDVLVIGAGQAGLSTSSELTRAGIPHVLLERGRVAQTWRTRWDSFCLVTPNWSVQLPGHPYDGDDPHGFMPREDLVSWLTGYAAAVAAPVVEGVEVRSLAPRPGGGFVAETSVGALTARDVVVCTGAYQRSHRPAAAAELPAGLLQIDLESYRRPEDLPPGAVLVVGSGQSGCQVAEELHQSGRRVFLACGRAPWAPRRIGDHDLFWWLRETGELEVPIAALQSPADRLLANVQSTGRDGGHDLHYRTLRRMGVTLLGHLVGADDGEAHFAADLADTVAWSDQRSARFLERVRTVAAERGLPVPDIPEPAPFAPEAPERVDLRSLGAVVFTSGFRPDYTSWVRCPDAFDERGFPIHRDGSSTRVPGLHFVGVHYLRKRKSSLLIGVGEDAALVAATIARARDAASRTAPPVNFR
jgi:putative flavoprotein involved in K+ transport